MTHVFFTTNDFSKEGGGTIRIIGLLNDIALANKKVTFVSNCPVSKRELFHKNVNHIFLDLSINNKKKRIFQGLLSFLPLFVLSVFYKKWFCKLKKTLEPFNKSNVCFFEYLDNSLGYVAAKKHWIQGYVNDIHGVATEEFYFQFKNAKSIKEKATYRVKYLSSKWLDKKVFENATGIIFSSNAMKDYFESKYLLQKVHKMVIPNLISSFAIHQTIHPDWIREIKQKYNITEKNRVILFAGSFKKTGGITDLIEAFAKVNSTFHDTILLLIGDGYTFNECKEMVNQYHLNKSVFFVGRIPHAELYTYQQLADVIVCPDKQNVFSDMILHLKYLDALISGKIVINGNFKSVQEINKNEFLSVNFIPSDVENLSFVIANVISNLDEYKSKYSASKKYVLEHLTYKHYIDYF